MVLRSFEIELWNWVAPKIFRPSTWRMSLSVSHFGWLSHLTISCRSFSRSISINRFDDRLFCHLMIIANRQNWQRYPFTHRETALLYSNKAFLSVGVVSFAPPDSPHSLLVQLFAAFSQIGRNHSEVIGIRLHQPPPQLRSPDSQICSEKSGWTNRDGPSNDVNWFFRAQISEPMMRNVMKWNWIELSGKWG
jgi:hypothetical protein